MENEATEALRGYVDTLVELHDQIDEIRGAIKDTLDAAKKKGFNPGAVKLCVKYARADQEKRSATETRLDHFDRYKAALGLTAAGDDPAPAHTSVH